MDSPNIDRRDWSALTYSQQVQQIETEGYLVLPDLLTADEIALLKSETASLETTAVDYSANQRTTSNVQFSGPALTALIGHPPAIRFLEALLGDQLVMMTYAYARSEPGHPGISLHTDGQPYGSAIFGYEGSCPVLIRVLYYLDELTPDVSPFRVVPRSHLCLHADANPYLRYESHPDEVMVTVAAGSAVLIHHGVFHGNFPNTGTRSREMLALAYRPSWAGPIHDVNEWETSDLDGLSPEIRALLGSRNQRHATLDGKNKPANMRREAPGMDPNRWSSGDS
jgi:ectoine hydroxylase-related dioxygenase (phytanoyl-CoA dioxygenase family)